MRQELGVSAKFADFMQQGLDSVELTAAVQVSFTGLAQIVRLGPVFWLQIPVICLNLAHDLGQPYKKFVVQGAMASWEIGRVAVAKLQAPPARRQAQSQVDTRDAD
jgi:hypothetical protein